MKIRKPSLWNDRVEFDEDITFYEVEEKLRQTLSRLMAWRESDDYFDFLRIDGDGNLQVTTEGSTKENLEPSVATVGATASLIVASRTNRKGLTLYNEGSVNVYFRSGATPVVATDFVLPPNSTYNLDNFIGNVYGIVDSGSASVRVLEVY